MSISRLRAAWVDPSSVHLHDKQDVEPAQQDGIESEKVRGQEAGGLSAQEGPPASVRSAWCRPETGRGQNPADRTRAETVSEPNEFALDASMAPGRILLRYARHEVADLLTDGWAVGPGWIGPLLGDQAAMPGEQSGWSNDPTATLVSGE
jgi:hypothetical protein